MAREPKLMVDAMSRPLWETAYPAALRLVFLRVHIKMESALSDTNARVGVVLEAVEGQLKDEVS